MSSREFLRRRNALWQRLRTLPVPRDAQGLDEFEAAVAELSGLTGWNRAQVLAGLGLSDADVHPPDPAGQP